MCTILAPLACVLLLVFAGVASAQTPSPDATLRAFRIAEKHIREWRLPPDPSPKGPENSEVPKAVGACITLKLRGEVIGRGAAWSDAIAGPEAFSNDVLRRAILAAMQQADSKLGVPNDAMRDGAIKLVTPDILISVELAGPLSVVEFNTWEDAEVTLRPGLDGVAARIGGEAGGKQGTLHAIFPSQMMLGNMLPHRAMGAVASKAIGEGGAAAALDDPKKLREASGVRMYRFRVGQVAQSSSSFAPRVLFRGGAAIDSGIALSQQELNSMADALARHLLLAFGTVDVHIEVHGITHKWTRAAFERGRISELAFAILAMYRYALQAGPGRVEAHKAIGFAEVACREVLGRGGKQGTPEEVTFAALIAEISVARPCEFYDCSTCKPGTTAGIHKRFRDVLSVGDSDWTAKNQPEQLRPIMAAVYPNLVDFVGGQHTPEEHRIVCERAMARFRSPIAAILVETPESQLPGTMPWLGWGELMASDCAAPLCGKRPDLPAALLFRRMRSDCWKHQLSITDATEDTLDMTGGIIFTAGDGNLYPTWQCVRPLAFIATMLRDPRLTEPGERSEQIVRLMQAARFLRQLQVDEASAWMYPDPKLAIGGIRASTWDNSLPVDATSMTLLFVVELIKSLDALSAAQQPPAIGPAGPGADAPKPK